MSTRRKIAQPLDHDSAVGRLRALGRWPLHVPRAKDVIAAAQRARTARLSFWDSMIVVSANALGCALLWSEDLNDGQQIDGVTIRNPFRG